MPTFRFAYPYRNVTWMFRGAGISLPWEKRTIKEQIFYRTAVIVMAWKMICCGYKSLVNDFVEGIMAQSSVIVMSMEIFIIYSYNSGKERLSRLLSEIENLSNNIGNGQSECRHYFWEECTKQDRLLNRLAIILHTLAVACPCVYFLSGPLLRYTIGQKTLRVTVSCPFEYAIPDAYVVFEILQALTFSIAAVSRLASDLIIYKLIKSEVCIFKFLQKLTEEIKADPVTEETKHKVRDFIQIHNEAIRYSLEISEFYSVIIIYYYAGLINFSVQLLFYFFNAETHIFQTGSLLGYFVATVLQFFLLCDIADELTQTAAEIAFAVYSMPWYNWEPKSRRQLLSIMCIANRPWLFTAFKLPIFNINRGAFKSYVINIVSAYMGLRNMRDH